MGINKEDVRSAINGDRHALVTSFVWGETPQGYDYWVSQYRGHSPIDVDTLKSMIGDPVVKLEVGNTYTSINGREWECIFVRDGKAWMTTGGAAYIFNAETGENISQGGGEYNIAFPERRNGSVEYVNGEPQFDTWKEDE